MAQQHVSRTYALSGSEALRAMAVPLLERLGAERSFERAFVVLIDPTNKSVSDVIGLSPASPLFDAFGVPPAAPDMLIQVLQRGRATFVPDVSTDPRITPAASAAYRLAGVTSFWMVPLLPASAVLVASRPDECGPDAVDDLLGMTSQLAALLWEHVTAKERDAAKSTEQPDWLREMLNAVPDPVVLTDEQNNIVFQNEHARRLFEASTDDTPGKRRAIELNNFLLSTALSGFVLDQGASLGREFTAVDPVEGSELLFEVICQSIDLPGTAGRHLVSVLRNVTDLHGAIEELRHSLRELQETNNDLRYERDRLDLVLENVADPIIVTGPANDIVLVNASAKRLLQSPDEQHNRRQPAAYYTNDTKFMAFLLDLRLSQEDVQQGELQLIDPASEEELAVNITATKVNDSYGQLAATVSVLHDLTQVRELERRRLEHQLFESEKLAAMGRLTAAVAHEINNPLESIKNSLHLLQDDVSRDSPNRKFLEIATKETDRVSRVIREMLGFYRGGATRTGVSVNALIEEVITLLHRQFAARDVRVRTDLDPDLPLVTASGDQLKQVLLNLFLNAEEVMGTGGQLTIATRRPRAKEAKSLERESVFIEVSDTGPGIAEEHIAQIFDPFFSTKRDRGGTGLGLWVCHDIIKHHGGEIRVNSRLRQGTTFTITLPIKETDV